MRSCTGQSDGRDLPQQENAPDKRWLRHSSQVIQNVAQLAQRPAELMQWTLTSCSGATEHPPCLSGPSQRRALSEPCNRPDRDVGCQWRHRFLPCPKGSGGRSGPQDENQSQYHARSIPSPEGTRFGPHLARLSWHLGENILDNRPGVSYSESVPRIGCGRNAVGARWAVSFQEKEMSRWNV